MADKPPWFPFYARDWVLDPVVKSMPLDVQGAYLLLLCWQWMEEVLPKEPRNIAVISGIHLRSFRRIWPTLEPLFPETTLENGKSGRANPRLDRERKAYTDKHLELSEYGKRGAEARWGGHSQATSPKNGHPNGNQNQNHSTAIPSSRDDGPQKEPKEEIYNPDNPWHKDISAIAKWFYTDASRQQPKTKAQKQHILETLRKIVDLDMDDTAEEWRIPRLRAVLDAAMSDDFWRPNLLSLRSLRKKSTGSDVPKWKQIEAHLHVEV